MRILILEDNAERRTAMLEHIADSLPMFGVSFFETSDAIISALKSVDQNEIALNSLDNDLDPIVVNGQAVDAGDGVTVARFLVNRPHDGSRDKPHTTCRNCSRPRIVNSVDACFRFKLNVNFDVRIWRRACCDSG